MIGLILLHTQTFLAFSGQLMYELGSKTNGVIEMTTELSGVCGCGCENKLPWIDHLSDIKSFEQSIER